METITTDDDIIGGRLRLDGSGFDTLECNGDVDRASICEFSKDVNADSKPTGFLRLKGLGPNHRERGATGAGERCVRFEGDNTKAASR